MVERFDVVWRTTASAPLTSWALPTRRPALRNPGIIYCSVSGFGQTGPYRDRAALDLIVQAESGMISITGEPGGRGVRSWRVDRRYGRRGMWAAFGIMNALRVKEKTGKGQYVDVSMLEGQLGLLQGTIGGLSWPTEWSPSPWAQRTRRCSPIRPSVPKPKIWRWRWAATNSGGIFCPILGLEEMLDDPRYATNAARVQNRD